MDKKPVQIRDLYDFSTLSGVKLSPDGRYAAFSVSRADEKKNGYISKIWVYDRMQDSCRVLTQSGSDRIAYWEDDETLIITSARKPGEEKEPKRLSRFFRIRLTGGEAEEAFAVPETVGEVLSVRDNRMIFRTFTDFAKDEKDDKKEKKGYQVFDEIPFWHNGRGFSNGKRSALMQYDFASGEVKNLTEYPFEAGSASVSSCGKYLCYAGAPLVGQRKRQSGLFLRNLETNEVKTVLPFEENSVGQVQFLHGGRVFLTLNPFKDSHSNSLPYVLDLRTKELTALKDENVALSGMVKDGERLFVCHDHYSASRLCEMLPDGTLVPFALPENMAVMSFDVKDGFAVFSAEAFNGLQELYVYEKGVCRCVSHVNDAYAESHEILPVDAFTFKNRAGMELDGFVIRPLGYDPEKTYPGLLEIHGGPKARYNPGFNHEMQTYAAKGYFVFFCNPRGSSGRGSEFADVTGKLGTIDYEDVMDFTDAVLLREKALDPERLGVLGGSYGGFMTNWIIGHTDRFKAACSQRSISNYVTKCLTTDIGHLHNLSQMETDPWQDFDKFWFHSPLKYADRVKTPTLFIHSDHDFRCWMSEGIQMHQALVRFGVPSKLCLFADENHELSRSGKPKGRIGRLEEMLNWFEQYLK